MTNRTRENLEIVAYTGGAFVAIMVMINVAYWIDYLMIGMNITDYDRGGIYGVIVTAGLFWIIRAYGKISASRIDYWARRREESEDYS